MSSMRSIDPNTPPSVVTHWECPTCGYLSSDPDFIDGRKPCPACGATVVADKRRVFPTVRLQRLDSRIRRYQDEGEHEIVVILAAAFLEAILEDLIDRILICHGADLPVRRALLDSQRGIGQRLGKLIPELTGEEFEDVAAQLGYRDFPHRWRDMRDARNAFIHDSPFHDAQEALDARLARQAMELLDQAYMLFVGMNNRFVCDGRKARPA
jgi:predicted RNA-binding Zn-ribbon protein involved in translation (DUF1610 family)